MVSCDDSEPPPPPPGASSTLDVVAPAPNTSKSGLAAVDLNAANSQKLNIPSTPTGPPADPRQAIFLGIQAPTSPTWLWEPAKNNMRVMNWIIPAPEGAEAGELVITHFAEAAGNTKQANIDRWSRQFRNADLPVQPDVSEESIDGMAMTLVELRGEYLGMGGGWHKENYAMIVAMIDSPYGSLFIKLLGPDETVDRAREDYLSMLRGMRLIGSSG